jgi:hypothetical protein
MCYEIVGTVGNTPNGRRRVLIQIATPSGQRNNWVSVEANIEPARTSVGHSN